MTSWVVWAVALAVALLIGCTATNFGVGTLRYVTVAVVIAALVAVTAYGQTPPVGQVPSDLQNAFAFGADQLSAAFFHPLWALWSSRQTPVPGRVGWCVIAAALLLGYRQAEARAQRRAGPQLDSSKLAESQPSIVDVSGASVSGGPAGRDGLTAGQRHDWLAAELRFRLAAADIYAPPILPGGSRSDGLASIAESTGVSGAGLAAALIRFLAGLWPGPRRYELRVWVEGPAREAPENGRAPAPADGGTAERSGQSTDDPVRVTVEIDEPLTGQTVASKTIVAGSIDDAASLVAGYVARQIFARDPVTPLWCYGTIDGRDIGALLLARQERVYAAEPSDVWASRQKQIRLLSTMTGADRCAGVVRYELAQLHDLDHRQDLALGLHSMNREQYPRFFRGNYRLCMSLEMIADPEYLVWDPDMMTRALNQTLSVLYRAGVADIDRIEKSGPGPLRERSEATSPDGRVPQVLSLDLREVLLKVARRELRTIRHQLSFPAVVWNTFWYRDERVVWRPHWQLARRQEFRDGVCVAEILVAVKHRLNERVKQAERVVEEAYRVERSVFARGAEAGQGAGTVRPPAPVRSTAKQRLAEYLAAGTDRIWRRKGLRVMTAIAGDPSAVRVVLRRPFADWTVLSDVIKAEAAAHRDPAGQASPAAGITWWGPRADRSRPTRDRVRWLPWRARTASWPAAYNTACLYAVLAKQNLAREEQVVESLRRVVSNRDSGIERPHDWISNDPDIAPLLCEPERFPKIHDFHLELERRDYPRGRAAGSVTSS